MIPLNTEGFFFCCFLLDHGFMSLRQGCTSDINLVVLFSGLLNLGTRCYIVYLRVHFCTH